VNAKDRIGNGPWFNAKGVMIAPSNDVLHNGQGAMGALQRHLAHRRRAVERILDETGAPVPSGSGGQEQRHDILTARP
jgi:hypothetical protein